MGRTGISSVSLAPGRPSLKAGCEDDVPAALCLLQEPAQHRAAVGNWEMLLTCEAVLLCQLAQRSEWPLQRTG